MRYVTLSLVFLALFPTRLAAQDIDQRTLEVPHLLAKKCLSHGLRGQIENHCGFRLGVTYFIVKDNRPRKGTFWSYAEIPANTERMLIDPPLSFWENLVIGACPESKRQVPILTDLTISMLQKGEYFQSKHPPGGPFICKPYA